MARKDAEDCCAKPGIRMSAPALENSSSKAPERIPELCPHRRKLREPVARAAHYCGLLTTLAGTKDEACFPVRSDECELCCRSEEPSPAGLNGITASTFYKGLRRINEAGLSILLVSHDMELMAVAEAVHVLNFGEIIARGDMAAIQQNADVREVYLGR